MNLFRGMPILAFTLVGGVVADRVERRRMMMMTQTLRDGAGLHADRHGLFRRHRHRFIVAIATGRGIMISFNLPVRHTLIPELVPRQHLPNAVALNSLTLNLTKIVGPRWRG